MLEGLLAASFTPARFVATLAYQPSQFIPAMEDSSRHVHDIDVIEELRGLHFRRILIDMHALVHVPPGKGMLYLHHASLVDFLMDQSRSHEFYIDASQGHVTLTLYWLKLLPNFRRS